MSSKSEDLRRQSPRYAIDALLDVQWEGGSSQGKCRNLSLGGVAGMLKNEVHVGQNCNLHLALRFDSESSSEPLVISARSAWCTPFESGYQVGFLFLNVQPEISQYLQLFIRYLRQGQRPSTPQSEDDPFA